MIRDADLEQSVGAGRIRPGFARTPELDLWWACGFPDLVIADASATPKKGALHWLKAREGMPQVAGRWPAEAVHALIHIVDLGEGRIRGKSTSERAESRQAVREEAATLGPPDDETCVRALRLTLGDGTRPTFNPAQIYAIEAVLGSERLMAEALDYYESLPPEVLGGDRPYGGAGLLQLGPVLHRLSPPAHASAIARLEKLLDVARDAYKYGTWARRPGLAVHRYFIASADVLLNGAEAATGLLLRAPSRAVRCQDPAFLSGYFTGLAGAKWTDVAPAAAFYAPEAVLNHYTRHWDEYTRKEQQIELIEVLGTLADARIPPWMLSMATSSKAKSQAKAWFVEHADELADFVTAIRDDPKNPHRNAAATLAKAMKL